MKKDECLKFSRFTEGNMTFGQGLMKMFDDELGSSQRAYPEPFVGRPRCAHEGTDFTNIDDAAKAGIHLSLVPTSHLLPITTKIVSPYAFCGCRRRPLTAQIRSAPRLSQPTKMPFEALTRNSSSRCDEVVMRRSDFGTARTRKSLFGFLCGKPRTFGATKDFLQ